jgi:hypothetical protein
LLEYKHGLEHVGSSWHVLALCTIWVGGWFAPFFPLGAMCGGGFTYGFAKRSFVSMDQYYIKNTSIPFQCLLLSFNECPL